MIKSEIPTKKQTLKTTTTKLKSKRQKKPTYKSRNHKCRISHLFNNRGGHCTRHDRAFSYAGAHCVFNVPCLIIIQYNTIQYNTIRYNTIHYVTIQYNTIQYNKMIYNTIQ